MAEGGQHAGEDVGSGVAAVGPPPRLCVGPGCRISLLDIEILSEPSTGRSPEPGPSQIQGDDVRRGLTDQPGEAGLPFTLVCSGCGRRAALT